MAASRFQYQTVFIKPKSAFRLTHLEDAYEELTQVLNNMAEAGWELDQHLPVPNPIQVYFILIFRKPAGEQ